MGLNIYFLDKDGEDVEIESYLRITHNLNNVVSELGLLLGLPYYEVIWAPYELFGLKNEFGATAGSFPSDNPLLMSIIYMVIIMAIFIPLSVRKYNNAANK